MAEYINREEFIQHIEESDLPDMAKRAVIALVRHMPAADVVEVKYSNWKYYHKQNIAVCMNCSFERDLDANFGKAITCPNCGAKMDGGNKDA